MFIRRHRKELNPRYYLHTKRNLPLLQTIENIHTIHSTVSLPVIQPLITYDKQEIIDLAKEIGTYEISIQPHDDCCSLFIPKHPATKSDIKQVIAEESKLDVETMVKETIKKIESVPINHFD